MAANSKVPIPRAFFFVAAANFLFFLSLAFFFLLPLWVLEHGGGEEVAGRVIGVAGFSGLVVLPLIGYLLDRFGRRRFMIAGSAIAAATAFAYLRLDGIGPDLYILRAIQGIAFTCAFTGAQTLAVLFAPLSRRAEALGWFGISTILTHAISPIIGEEIVTRWGFTTMFGVAGAVAVAALALACLIPKPPELPVTTTVRGHDPELARRAVISASLAMLCYGFGFGAVQTFVPVLMERFSIGRVGVFFSVWSMAAVAVRVFLGKTSDRYGRRTVLLPAMAMMSLSVLVLAFSRSLGGILTAAVIFGLAQGLLYPTMNALVADWSNPKNIGRIQSIFSGSYGFGIASCSFFFGSIAEHQGYQTMFLVALAVTTVGLGIFLAGPRDLAVREA